MKNKGEWHRVKDKDYREELRETEWVKRNGILQMEIGDGVLKMVEYH